METFCTDTRKHAEKLLILSGDISTDCISRCKSNYTYTCIINAWKALWNIIYMGKNLLGSAIKNKRANIH
jgi:hypothetical protein